MKERDKQKGEWGEKRKGEDRSLCKLLGKRSDQYLIRYKLCELW